MNLMNTKNNSTESQSQTSTPIKTFLDNPLTRWINGNQSPFLPQVNGWFYNELISSSNWNIVSIYTSTAGCMSWDRQRGLITDKISCKFQEIMESDMYNNIRDREENDEFISLIGFNNEDDMRFIVDYNHINKRILAGRGCGHKQTETFYS